MYQLLLAKIAEQGWSDTGQVFLGKDCALQSLDEAKSLRRVGTVDEGMDHSLGWTLGWDPSGSPGHMSRDGNGYPQDSEPLQCRTGISQSGRVLGRFFPKRLSWS